MTEGRGPRPPDETRRETPSATDGTRRETPAPPDGTRREAPSPSDATRLESPGPADATRAEEAPPGHAGAGSPTATGFPQDLAARFRPVRELDHGNQADVWLVEEEAGVPLVAKVYRPGFEGRPDILEILHGLEPNRDIVPVVSYGRAGGRLYVLLEYVPGGNLKSLMTPGEPSSPDLVREVLAQLVAALERLHGVGIEHHDLKPGNVLVRNQQPLDLVLADFGVATQASRTVRATRLSGMTWTYAPPEAFARNPDELLLWQHKFDAWSLGVMVVELLTGRNPLPETEMAIATFFATGNMDDLVEGVDDPAWRKLCRGLLRRNPEVRWGTAEARRWLEAPDAPELQVEAETAPAAAPSRGFRFVGRDYATPADLGAAMAGDWAMAEDLWRNQTPALLQWLRHELGSTEAAARVEEIDGTPGMGLDEQLFWAIRALAPQAPPSYRGEPLAAENLARIASRAAATPDGDDARLLTAVSRIPRLGSSIPQVGDAGNPALTAQAARWSGTAPAWEELRRAHGELPELPETDRIALLAAATEGSGVTEQLRERTSQVLAKWPRARKSARFRRLGDPRRAESPQLLAMALLAATTHERVKTETRERLKTRRLAIAAGALSGLVFLLIRLLIEPSMAAAAGRFEYVTAPEGDGADVAWRFFWGEFMSSSEQFAPVPAMVVGAAVALWLWWRFRPSGWVVLLCGPPAFLLGAALTIISLYELFGSVMILSYTIPGPLLVDASFIVGACLGVGFGLGVGLERLRLKLSARTFALAPLAVTLCIVLVCAAIGAARFPGWHAGLFGDPPPLGDGVYRVDGQHYRVQDGVGVEIEAPVSE